MMSIADTTALLDDTIVKLGLGSIELGSEASIQLIDQWTGPLQEGENTKPLADKMEEVKRLLQTGKTDEENMRNTLGELADMISELGPQMGSEGEMPSLLEGLATAIRQIGETSKAG